MRRKLEEVELYVEFNQDAARELDSMLETVAAVGMLLGTKGTSRNAETGDTGRGRIGVRGAARRCECFAANSH